MAYTVNLEELTNFINLNQRLQMPTGILKFILEENEIVSGEVSIKLRPGRDYNGAHLSSELIRLEQETMYPVLIIREGMFNDHYNYVYSPEDGRFIDVIML